MLYLVLRGSRKESFNKIFQKNHTVKTKLLVVKCKFTYDFIFRKLYFKHFLYKTLSSF